MDKLFKDKTVLISGGLGDIGRAIAIAFAQQGANIAIGDILPSEKAAAVIAELKQFEGQYSYSVVDIADASEVKKWVDEVEANIGIASLIIANAATVTLAGIHEISPEQWSRELNVNLNGAFNISQIATARLLHHQQAGRVVFIGSWAAHKPHTHIPAYCVSKAGVRMLCQCLALELAPHQILVNEIALGYVDAGLSASVWKQNPGTETAARNQVPIKKIISPQQVAWQVVNLCHPANEQMTGSTILMDGGLSLLS